METNGLDAAERKELNNLRREITSKEQELNFLRKIVPTYVQALAHGSADRLTNTRSQNIYKDHPKESFPFIPYSTLEIFKGFRKLKEAGLLRVSKIQKRKSFLDAGCGIGNQVLAAQKSGFFDMGRCHGIELNHELVLKGRQLLHDEKAIIKGNIITFDKYGDYDVIYFWLPIADQKLQHKFEENLENQMKIGALLLAIGKRSPLIIKDKRFIKIRKLNTPFDIYKKIKA